LNCADALAALEFKGCGKDLNEGHGFSHVAVDEGLRACVRTGRETAEVMGLRPTEGDEKRLLSSNHFPSECPPFLVIPRACDFFDLFVFSA
jgi:hypothetical protein